MCGPRCEVQASERGAERAGSSGVKRAVQVKRRAPWTTSFFGRSRAPGAPKIPRTPRSEDPAPQILRGFLFSRVTGGKPPRRCFPSRRPGRWALARAGGDETLPRPVRATPGRLLLVYGGCSYPCRRAQLPRASRAGAGRAVASGGGALRLHRRGRGEFAQRPWAASAAAIQAMGRDVASHRAIDGRRSDTAGWSGGARGATPVALGGLAKGVIAGGAGFPASGDGLPGVGAAGFAEAARVEAEPLFERLRNEAADQAAWPPFGRIRRSRRDGGGAVGAGGSETTPGLRRVGRGRR
jgi:hypothetical protein